MYRPSLANPAMTLFNGLFLSQFERYRFEVLTQFGYRSLKGPLISLTGLCSLTNPISQNKISTYITYHLRLLCILRFIFRQSLFYKCVSILFYKCVGLSELYTDQLSNNNNVFFYMQPGEITRILLLGEQIVYFGLVCSFVSF